MKDRKEVNEMKYGYNSEAYYEKYERICKSRFAEEVFDFCNHAYPMFMKRKTICSDEKEAFEMLEEMIEEMREHLKEMREV